MIDKTNNNARWFALSATLIGVTLNGCSQSTMETTPANTAATTQAAPDDHAHAPGTAPHAHEGDETKAHAASGHNHDAEIQATVGKFFPGASLAPKPFPFSADAAAHLSQDAGVKFTGNENKWQVFQATRDGKRIGLAVMTHSPLPDGKDMHIAFAVNPKFVVTHVTALDAPDNPKMQSFVRQFIGKTLKESFKAGQGLKVPAGLSPQNAQISADAVKKGLAILDDNFNAAHSEVEASSHSHVGTPHKEGDGHSH